MKRITLIVLVCIAVFSGSYYLLSTRNQGAQRSGTYGSDVKGLADSTSTPAVTLKNGQTYTLDARIVKKNISGQYVRMLAYNGSVPGPIITVTQGSTVHIKLINHTDVATTLHSHGVRIANAYDGVPGITQDVVEPGKSFTYTITFPDVGVFWYHPHFREDYTQESGLYGNYIVKPKIGTYAERVNREVPMFLDDVLMDGNHIATFNRGEVTHTLMGRFGNTMLVNGSTEYSDHVHAGDVVRYEFTNSSSTRVFRVAIPGAQMKLIGTDLSKFEREEFVDSVTIGPAERVIVDVLYGKPGTYHLQHISPLVTHELGKIQVDSTLTTTSHIDSFVELHTNDDVEQSIQPYRSAFAKPVDKSLTISIAMNHMSGAGGGGDMHMMHGGSMMSDMQMDMGTSKESIEWEDGSSMMNESSTNKSIIWKLVDQSTSMSNMDINWTFKKGDIVKIKVYNDPRSMHPMQHPFHIHGQRFLVLTKDGVAVQNLAWKDTVLIEKGQTVELLVDMSNPGAWMAHCHIPEHLESGMMLNFNVR